LQSHLDLSAEHGDPLPEPSNLDSATVDPDIVVAARLLVRVETTKAKPVRVNVMLPGDLLTAVDRYAARLGYTRSGLLAQAVRDKMRRENDAGAR
jgi:hypothetical protein